MSSFYLCMEICYLRRKFAGKFTDPLKGFKMPEDNELRTLVAKHISGITSLSSSLTFSQVV